MSHNSFAEEAEAESDLRAKNGPAEVYKAEDDLPDVRIYISWLHPPEIPLTASFFLSAEGVKANTYLYII